jgi:hypothetical protein
VAQPRHFTQQPPQFHAMQATYWSQVLSRVQQLVSEFAHTVTHCRVRQPVTAVHQLLVGSILSPTAVYSLAARKSPFGASSNTG